MYASVTAHTLVIYSKESACIAAIAGPVCLSNNIPRRGEGENNWSLSVYEQIRETRHVPKSRYLDDLALLLFKNARDDITVVFKHVLARTRPTSAIFVR